MGEKFHPAGLEGEEETRRTLWHRGQGVATQNTTLILVSDTERWCCEITFTLCKRDKAR